jgi:hypothetical protein
MGEGLRLIQSLLPESGLASRILSVRRTSVGRPNRHQRFALRDVRFAGVHLPGATMDCWEDEEGRAHWSARVVMRLGLVLDEGELAGRTWMDES